MKTQEDLKKINAELLEALNKALEVMFAYNRLAPNSKWAGARIEKICALIARCEGRQIK